MAASEEILVFLNNVLYATNETITRQFIRVEEELIAEHFNNKNLNIGSEMENITYFPILSLCKLYLP